MKKLKSVFDKNELNIKGSNEYTLTEEQRNIICNALTILSPKEVDILPMLEIVSNLCKNKVI